jgi:hypothetical protein
MPEGFSRGRLCILCCTSGATLGLALSTPGRATFNLRYVWRPDLVKDYELYMLCARLHVEFDVFEPAYEDSPVFLVDCKEG